MAKKNGKTIGSRLIRTHIYLPKDDWELSQKLAKKQHLHGADMVRKWIREGIEREGKK